MTNAVRWNDCKTVVGQGDHYLRAINIKPVLVLEATSGDTFHFMIYQRKIPIDSLTQFNDFFTVIFNV